MAPTLFPRSPTFLSHLTSLSPHSRELEPKEQRLLAIVILPGLERDPLVLPNDPPNEKMQPPERNYHHSIRVS